MGNSPCSSRSNWSREVEEEERRTHPAADRADAHLNWQAIAVRQAWKKANGEGPVVHGDSSDVEAEDAVLSGQISAKDTKSGRAFTQAAGGSANAVPLGSKKCRRQEFEGGCIISL